ncbi:hypothetical protein [Treponema phagedenis]|uniref:hypothetical protein n=1 Tax=Treponema phagedenis TaxID=162 RepID=UPI001652EF7D|nr:hypothetical protein [Treponema phagedenis]
MEIKVVENAVPVTGTDIENKSLSDSKREDLFMGTSKNLFFSVPIYYFSSFFINCLV